MPKYDDVTPALRWCLKRLDAPGLTAERVVAALRVEQLPYEQIPADLWPSVKAFRKLRTDVRIHVTRRYLSGLARRRRASIGPLD